MRQEKRNIFKLPLTARLVILLVYLIILSYFLFFAGGFGRTGESAAFSVNLLPFTEIIRCFKYYDSLPKGFFLSNFVGNIIAFIPFGFLFASLLLYKKRFTCLLTVLVSALLSAMVEIIQFVTRTGSCDIDDVILNTLGGTIGYIIFYVLFVRKEKE